jgi:hypothetical protein
MLRRRGIHGLTYLGSICPSLYLNEVNEVVGSQLSMTAGLAAAVNPLRSSHNTLTMNSWCRLCERSPGTISSPPFPGRHPDSLRDMLDSQKNQSAKGMTLAEIEGA